MPEQPYDLGGRLPSGWRAVVHKHEHAYLGNPAGRFLICACGEVWDQGAGVDEVAVLNDRLLAKDKTIDRQQRRIAELEERCRQLLSGPDPG